MALRLETSLPESRVEAVLSEIERVTAAGGELTPRGLDVLAERLAAGQLLMVFDSDELIAWALIEPLTKRCNELGMAFVKPERRSSGAFDLITAEMYRGNKTLVFATYNPRLVDFAIRDFGFRKSTLGEVLRASRGKFLLKRLDRSSRKSIQARMKTSQPLYAILERS